MKEFPESEIQPKNFADAGEKRSENLAKHFADFRPLISRKSGCKKFHEKSSTFFTRNETKFFHREILGRGCRCPNKTRRFAIAILGALSLVQVIDEADDTIVIGIEIEEVCRLNGQSRLWLTLDT